MLAFTGSFLLSWLTGWPLFFLLVPLFLFPGCRCCNLCRWCTSSPPTGRFQVTLPTITNGTCSSCAGYAGTYVLDFLIDGTSDPPTNFQSCFWNYDIPSPLCGADDDIELAITDFGAPAGLAYQIRIMIDGVQGLLWGPLSSNQTTDCGSVSGLSVPNSTGSACNTTSSATLTAI